MNITNKSLSLRAKINKIHACCQNYVTYKLLSFGLIQAYINGYKVYQVGAKLYTMYNGALKNVKVIGWTVGTQNGTTVVYELSEEGNFLGFFSDEELDKRLI